MEVLSRKVALAVAAKLEQALAFHKKGQLSQAQMLYGEILRLAPKHRDALNLSGIIWAQTNNPQKAIELFDRAIAADPNNAQIHCNRGLALQSIEQWNAALAGYDRAIALQPDYAEAHFNRGNLLQATQELEAALASYDRAIAIRPDYAEAYANRSVVLKDLRQLDASLRSCNQAIAINPGLAQAYCNRAYTRLLAGDLENGWLDYEWRRRLRPDLAFAERGGLPELLRQHGPQSIAGRTILLRAEQGFGDTIQFSRYAKLLAAAGAKVILEVPQRLAGLLAGMEGVSQLVIRGSTLPDFDYQCPLMSLPLAFATTLDTIPSPGRYLRADPGKIAQWRRQLTQSPEPLVGLAWSGSSTNTNDRNRSIPLADLIRHLPDGLKYVSLQKEVREPDLQTLECHPHILDFADEQADFSDAAALCECMDVVISVDTSVAHLSGALGKPTWILLPFNPDWRWSLMGDESPWYPTVKLYRQAKRGDWAGVLERVGAELRGGGLNAMARRS